MQHMKTDSDRSCLILYATIFSDPDYLGGFHYYVK